MAKTTTARSPNGAALFEAANKLRGSVESAEYKHLVLGLLFLKYIRRPARGTRACRRSIRR
jgi:type I restriction enzyme M protein